MFAWLKTRLDALGVRLDVWRDVKDADAASKREWRITKRKARLMARQLRKEYHYERTVALAAEWDAFQTGEVARLQAEADAKAMAAAMAKQAKLDADAAADAKLRADALEQERNKQALLDAEVEAHAKANADTIAAQSAIDLAAAQEAVKKAAAANRVAQERARKAIAEREAKLAAHIVPAPSDTSNGAKEAAKLAAYMEENRTLPVPATEGAGATTTPATIALPDNSAPVTPPTGEPAAAVGEAPARAPAVKVPG